MPLWKQLLRPFSIVLPNLRDGILAGVGAIQSLVKLLIWRPDVVFTKGGFVCLPVGLAARVLNIPLVIHDSDAHPGLTNRILSRWATAIATGAPLEYYSYNPAIARYVGIPISSDFKPFTPDEQIAAKRSLGFNPATPLVVVTGGGLGAQRVNDATVAALPELLPYTSVSLVSGAGQYDQLLKVTPKNDDRFQLHAFISNGMATLLGAADVVVTRAGATTILELAALAKPTILIPNGFLTGGHQLKNAAVYAEAGAVELVVEDTMMATSSHLPHAIINLLNDTDRRSDMASRFHEFSRPNAARDMADMIEHAAK